jgi:hypothetical protein
MTIAGLSETNKVSTATPKPPNRKRALERLAASGAVPISVTERDGMCSTIRGGGDGLSAQWWVDRTKAVPVARAARRFAGANPDLSTATDALARAAGWARPCQLSIKGWQLR